MLGLDQEREELGGKHVSYRYGDPSFKYVCLFVCVYLQYSKQLVHKDSNLICLIVGELLPLKSWLETQHSGAKIGSPAPSYSLQEDVFWSPHMWMKTRSVGPSPLSPAGAANRLCRPLSYFLQAGYVPIEPYVAQHDGHLSYRPIRRIPLNSPAYQR